MPEILHPAVEEFRKTVDEVIQSQVSANAEQGITWLDQKYKAEAAGLTFCSAPPHTSRLHPIGTSAEHTWGAFTEISRHPII